MATLQNVYKHQYDKKGELLILQKLYLGYTSTIRNNFILFEIL